MASILLVKTSSLGDVVHNLPVVSDIRRHLGDIAIDWVVERSFAAVPAMHSGVRYAIACELRRWRGSWWSSTTRSQWRAFIDDLRSRSYQTIIDTQGLFKSAAITRLARGHRVGLDWSSSREPLGAFYHRTCRVPWCLHAVERNRRLAAVALGYTVEGAPDYGIRADPCTAAWLPRSRYIVLLHATSDARKLWPEQRWIELGARLAERGFDLVLPWGAADEERRALRVVKRIGYGCVPPALGIAELASVLAGARAVVGLDTGLTHLAGALQRPVVGIYGTTDPVATGVYAGAWAANLGGRGGFPSVQAVFDLLSDLGTLDVRHREGQGA